MGRSNIAGTLAVAALALGVVWSSGCGAVRTFPAERTGGESGSKAGKPETVAGVPDGGRKPGPDEGFRAAREPLFRKTECNGVCVEIVLDASEDYAFTRRYVESIGRRIVLNVVYPWETIEKGAEGEVEIHGRVDRKGALISKEIIRGSGTPLLDNAALNSLFAAAPFNPFPPSPYVQSLGFKATFRYFQ